MQRRDLFNIIFKSNSSDGPIVSEPDPVLETPAYLLLNETEPSFQVWASVPEEGIFIPDHDMGYAFTMKLDLTLPISSPPSGSPLFELVFGLSNATSVPQSGGVKLGFNASGKLFIDYRESENNFHNHKLGKSIQLILEVKPQPAGRSYAKLRLLDRSGLTLSILKSDAYLMSDWSGSFSFYKAEKVFFHLLRIEGRRTTELSNHKISEFKQL